MPERVRKKKLKMVKKMYAVFYSRQLINSELNLMLLKYIHNDLVNLRLIENRDEIEISKEIVGNDDEFNMNEVIQIFIYKSKEDLAKTNGCVLLGFNINNDRIRKYTIFNKFPKIKHSDADDSEDDSDDEVTFLGAIKETKNKKDIYYYIFREIN